MEGATLLTDPVWDSYCSPFPIPKLKRKIPPPIPLADLPPIDFVLISHNHYDHLDAKTVRHLKAFHPQTEWIVPAGLSPWFRRRGIERVSELRWWDRIDFPHLSISATPAQHFSGRTLWDKNKTHWNGYVVESKRKKLYFTGDTGYNRYDFKAIGERWGGFDLSLIPIGTYVPRKFMEPVHIGPFEAVQIHEDVRSRLSLGMHWKTFRLSEEPLDAPPYDLYLAMKEKNLPFSSFLPIDPGTYVNW
jgi:N-acyl-phosphatidylethanolamine-hydrolysing phospholipase D